MSRVFSARIAVLKATEEKLDLKGAVMDSDAFLLLYRYCCWIWNYGDYSDRGFNTRSRNGKSL
jgi:hypothetical protein